ncbi:hypothetical protein QE152_g27177 [Popillia japonica]|uniref:Uncharacterized protein n=1 Tax=Popillia japonica TaxID=7064 RepID=A0AAW1JVS6_POPJA
MGKDLLMDILLNRYFTMIMGKDLLMDILLNRYFTMIIARKLFLFPWRCEQLDKMMGCTGSKRTCSCFGVKKRKISYDEEYSSSSCRSSEVDVQYRGCRMRKADTSGLLQMLVPRNFFRGFRKNHDLSMTKIEIRDYLQTSFNGKRCEQLDKMMGCTGSKRTCSCFGVKKRKISYDEEYSSSSCRSSEVDVQYRGCRMRKADTSGLLQMLVPRNFFRGFRKNHDLSMTKIEINRILFFANSKRSISTTINYSKKDAATIRAHAGLAGD